MLLHILDKVDPRPSRFVAGSFHGRSRSKDAGSTSLLCKGNV
jgi:hypothetical protein